MEPRRKKQKHEGEAGMKEGLWGTLPDEIIERVLVCLPTPNRIRAATVCKGWKELIFSDRFKESCSRAPAQHPWLVGRGNGNTMLAYSSAENKTYRLKGAIGLPSRSEICSGASGLLCAVSVLHDHVSVYLVDPLSQYVKQLPKLQGIHHYDGAVISLQVDENTCPLSYRVLAFVHMVPEGFNTVIYHSAAEDWRPSGSRWPLPSTEVLDAVVVGAHVYCIFANYFGGLSMGAYDYRLDVWTEVCAPMLSYIKSPRLADSSSQLILVGRAGKTSRTTDGIEVFCMDILTGKWEEWECMPANKCKYFVKRQISQCAGGAKGELYLGTGKRQPRIVKYDHSKRSWITLPSFSQGPVVRYEPRWGAYMPLKLK